MKQITAEYVLLTKQWFLSQTGKGFDDLPEVTQLNDGRYRAEINIPVLETLCVAAGLTKLEAIDRLFKIAFEEIGKYCRRHFLKTPSLFINDEYLIEEKNGAIKMVKNEKYAGKPHIKCPICGGEHFVEARPPLNYSPDSGFFCEDVYGCVNCGYIIMFNRGVPKTYKQTLEKIEEIDNRIAERKRVFELNNNQDKIIKQHKDDLKRFKKELKQRQEWGEDNKTTRALIESIAYEEEFLKNGHITQNEQSIKQFNYDIDQLEKQKRELENKIKFLSL